MRTEDLIEWLAADGASVAAVRTTVLAAWAPALLATLVLALAVWGLRSGLGAALADPLVVAKIALPTLAAGVALAGGLALARPEGRPRATIAGLAAIAAAWLALLALNLATVPPATWGDALRGQTLLACLLSIPTLTVIPAATLLLALCRGRASAPGSRAASPGSQAGRRP